MRNPNQNQQAGTGRHLTAQDAAKRRIILVLALMAGLIVCLGAFIPLLAPGARSFAAPTAPGFSQLTSTLSRKGEAAGPYLLSDPHGDSDSQQEADLTLTVSDADEDTSLTVTYKRTVVDDQGHKKTLPEETKEMEEGRTAFPGPVTPPAAGGQRKYTVTLDQEGLYPFSDMTFTLSYRDRESGQEKELTKTLADLVRPAQGGTDAPQGSAVALPEIFKTKGLTTLLLTKGEGKALSLIGQGDDPIEDRSVINGKGLQAARMTLSYDNPYFVHLDDLRQAWEKGHELTLTRQDASGGRPGASGQGGTADSNKASVSLKDMKATHSPGQGYRYFYDLSPLASKLGQNLTDGNYVLSYVEAGQAKAWEKVDFQLDRQKPALKVQVPQVPKEEKRKEAQVRLSKQVTIDGKKEDVLVTSTRPVITLTITDPVGLAPSSLHVTAKRSASMGDLNSRTVDLSRQAKLVSSEPTKLTYEVTLEESGLYRLADMTVSIQDRAGNFLSDDGSAVSLLTGLSDKPYDAILVDLPQPGDDALIPALSVEAANEKVGVKKTDKRTYFRGDVVEKVSLRSPWLEIYQKIPGFTIDLVTIKDSPTAETTSLPLSRFAFDRKEKTTTATFRRTVAVEGNYQLSLKVLGKTGEPVLFTIDKTAPTVSSLTLSPQGKVSWGWIFSSRKVTISLDGLDDMVSGLDPSSVHFALYNKRPAGPNAPALTVTPGRGNDRGSADSSSDRAAKDQTGKDQAGKISFTVDGNGTRLTFADTVITFSDLAGNTTKVTLSDFFKDAQGKAKYRSNIADKGVQGLAIDQDRPQITLSYDNNAVHQEKFFSAARTATFRLTDSSFDLIRRNDPQRVIVAVSHDGSTRGLRAKDFSPVHGEPGVWFAQVTCDADGDWILLAHMTDPVGQTSDLVRSSFTIDMTKPVINLTFDNNDSANGNYYKANRTATITVFDRNADLSATQIMVTAKDSHGKPVPAPAPSAWTVSSAGSQSRIRNEKTWKATVAFTGECRYSISVRSADKAGNVAESVKESEFIIDKTLPDLSITDVADQTAYAGAIAPRIDSSDANLDDYATTYTLKAAHNKDSAVDLMPKVDRTATSQNVAYGDFPHKLPYDDYYTLTAVAKDKAGNVIKRTISFSVNRFGSVYSFDPATQGIRGRYLKKGQQVVVRETNVSGLKASSLHAEMVKGARTIPLDRSQYTVKTSDDKGWSLTTYSFPAALFRDDGYYRLQLTSVDKAGNLAQNTMEGKGQDRKSAAEVNFAVDSRRPDASLSGVSSGGVYYAPSKGLSLFARDNMKVQKVELYRDGKQVGSWNQGSDSPTPPQHTIQADGRPHTYVLKVYDAAGNASTAHLSRVMVASNWWQYIRSVPSLFNRFLAACIFSLALLAGLGFLLARLRKARKARHNPFAHR